MLPSSVTMFFSGISVLFLMKALAHLSMHTTGQYIQGDVVMQIELSMLNLVLFFPSLLGNPKDMYIRLQDSKWSL